MVFQNLLQEHSGVPYLQSYIYYHFNYFLVTGSVHVSWSFSISEQ